MSDEFVNQEPETVLTYLALCRKYPAAREDLLNLRRQKNTALAVSLIGYFFIGLLIGWLIL